MMQKDKAFDKIQYIQDVVKLYTFFNSSIPYIQIILITSCLI